MLLLSVCVFVCAGQCRILQCHMYTSIIRFDDITCGIIYEREETIKYIKLERNLYNRASWIQLMPKMNFAEYSRMHTDRIRRMKRRQNVIYEATGFSDFLFSIFVILYRTVCVCICALCLRYRRTG